MGGVGGVRDLRGVGKGGEVEEVGGLEGFRKVVGMVGVREVGGSEELEESQKMGRTRRI